MRRAIPERIRITKLGFWYVLATLLLGLTATNTGNNSLYLVFSAMLSILVLSGILSRLNLKRIDVTVQPVGEIFAGEAATLKLEIRNRGRFFGRWLFEVSLDDGEAATWIGYLGRRQTTYSSVEVVYARRGLRQIRAIHLASVFPLGLFRKGLRLRPEVEVLVYPRLLEGAASLPPAGARSGERAVRRVGFGYDLHALRAFAPGDDPRSIHWKQSARTGRLVFIERRAEENPRLAIVVDNAVGEPPKGTVDEAFEHAVSAAASTAIEGFRSECEVELVTRTTRVPAGRGPRQRRLILEALALLEPVARTDQPMSLPGTSTSEPQARTAVRRVSDRLVVAG